MRGRGVVVGQSCIDEAINRNKNRTRNAVSIRFFFQAHLLQNSHACVACTNGETKAFYKHTQCIIVYARFRSNVSQRYAMTRHISAVYEIHHSENDLTRVYYVPKRIEQWISTQFSYYQLRATEVAPIRF